MTRQVARFPSEKDFKVGFRMGLPKRKLGYNFFFKLAKAQPFRFNNATKGR